MTPKRAGGPVYPHSVFKEIYNDIYFDKNNQSEENKNETYIWHLPIKSYDKNANSPLPNVKNDTNYSIYNEEIYNLAMQSLNIDESADAADIQRLQQDAVEEGEIDTHNEFYDFGNLREGYDDGYDPDGYAEEEDFADT